MIYFLQTDRGEGIQGMINLPGLLRNLGLEEGKDVIFCNQQVQATVGFPQEYLADVYSALDCHMLVSAGEGFGIPTIEAQACGTPVIVGDWTAHTELCFSGRMVSKKDAEPIYTSFEAYQYVPHVRGIEHAIECEYKHPSPTGKGVRMVKENFDVDVVRDKHWKPVLDKIQKAVDNVQLA